MRGSIVRRKRKDGTFADGYTIIVSYKDAQGKRRQVWKTYQCNKPEAEKKLREMLTELDKGTFVHPGKETVREYLTRWLADYCKPNLSPRTHELYRYMCDKHIIPSLGNIRLSELNVVHLQHLYAEKLASGLSKRTVQLIHVTIHKALKSGVGSVLNYNVAELLKDKPKAGRPEQHTMSEADMHIFLDAARGTEHYALFYVYLFTAMRRSELLALTWDNVDLKLGQVSVTRTMQYLHSEPVDNRISFKQPKTLKSRRLISLTPSTVDVLIEHLATVKAKRKYLEMPEVTDKDLVFCHWDGTPFVPTSITRAWRRLADRTGFKGIRLHDARHSHASILLKQNVHPKVVQERLGHANIAITMDIYSHVMPGMQQAAANKFDEALGNSVSKPLASST